MKSEFRENTTDTFLHKESLSAKVDKKIVWLNLLRSFLMIMISVIMVTFSGILLDHDNTLCKPYFCKSIKVDIGKAIQNNADIEVVKHIYNQRLVKKGSLFDVILKKSQDEKYLEGTPLSIILNDILADYYLNGQSDSIYLRNIHAIILLHNQTNPFDKLEPNQKNDFENLRCKLDGEYGLVENDINRISEALYHRNQLVNTYLDKSNLSYWISIVALVLTILLSLYQILQNTPKKLTKIIKSALNSVDEKDE